MNANEMIKIISKVWCTNEDLQKLSGLGITPHRLYPLSSV